MTVLDKYFAPRRWKEHRASIALLSITVMVFLLAVPVSLQAQDKLPLLTGPELGLPSIWRVLLGFVVVAGVAFGMAALLRKGRGWLPLPAAATSPGIIITSYRKLSRNVDVHVIEVNSERFMIVSSAQQIAVTSLTTPVQHGNSGVP